MTRPLAQILSDIEPGSEQSAPGLMLPGPARMRGAEAVAAKMEEAYERGLADGRAAVRAECDARLEQLAKAAEEARNEDRAHWVATEGDRLARLIADGLEALETRIAEQTARVLRPALVEDAQKRAIRELADTLDAMLAKGDVAKLTVSGPEDLVAAIRDRLDGKVQGAAFATAPHAELRIEVDETILETRIGAWAETIRGTGE